MKKRGQITLFIILGVLILLAVFTFFYIRSRVVERALIEEIPVIARVPIEFEPVRLFTQNCLEKVGTEGLKILGGQGGYIDTAASGISSSSLDPTEADALEFSPGSNIKVPYWWYLKAKNDCGGNCLFSSLRPPLRRSNPGDDSIEAQLDRYIETEILTCLDNYNVFVAQGFTVTPLGETESRTRVTSSDVSLYLNYPVRVELADKSFRMNDFYATIPVDLERIYQFATDITNAQIEHKFLEKQMLDLLTAFSGLDANKLPPFSASTFGTEQSVVWLRSTVKERIEAILMTYVPAFQIFNTLNFRKRYLPDPLQAAVYAASELPINLSRESQPYIDLAASFSYLGWWPIYFDINSKGELIKGSQGINDLAEFFRVGLTRYNNVYDLSYPVVVEIQDPAAFNEQGYLFRFALESNFRNNEPIDEQFQGLEGVIMFQSSLLCNYNQRNSGNVSIKVIDVVTKEPIPDVSVGFQCGEEGCQIGETDSNGSLVSRFPVCFGGLLVLNHPDYFMPVLYLSTNFNKSVDFPTVEAYPFIDKEIKIMKYLTSALSTRKKKNGGGKYTTQALPLGEDDEAILSLTRQKDFVGDIDHMAAARLRGNETTTLRLVEGTYKLSIDLVYHKPVVIPEEEREEGSWPSKEEYTIPEITINDSYIKGGVLFDETSGYLIIPDKLYENNTLIFFVIDTELPTVVEEMYGPELTEKFSTQFRSRLEPAYIE